MRTKIVWLFAIILMQACVAQKQTPKKKGYSSKLKHTERGMEIDISNAYDVIVADITKGSMFSIPFGLGGFSEGTHFFDLSPQSTDLRNLRFSTYKDFNFYNGEKDMEIECKCRENQNYYLKNLKIEDGNYKLTYKKGIKIKGSEIKVSDSIQNTLFKNIRANIHTKSKNIYFKDLEFVVLDLADTLNVKLKKIN